MTTALQIAGLILGLLGWGSTIVTTFIPSWQKSDIQGEVIEIIRRYSGLWTRCTAFATGIATCDDYDSIFLGLPVPLQVGRSLACLGILFGLLGTIVLPLGMKCTTFGGDNSVMKSRMVMIAGIMYIIAGTTIGGAVSWFAANITQDYYNVTIPQQFRFVYGEALFVGWAAMVFFVIAGAVLFCASWSSNSEDSYRSYSYNPPKSKPSHGDYV